MENPGSGSSMIAGSPQLHGLGCLTSPFTQPASHLLCKAKDSGLQNGDELAMLGMC